MLVQFAKRFGARVIGTVSFQEKADAAREAGADEVVDYSAQDFADEVLELTGRTRAALVLDCFGKATFDGDVRAAAGRGHIVVFGAASGPAEPLSPWALLRGSRTVPAGDVADGIATHEELLARANDVLEGHPAGVADLADPRHAGPVRGRRGPPHPREPPGDREGAALVLRLIDPRLATSWSTSDIMMSTIAEVAAMTNVLIRGLSDEAVARIDRSAEELGLSRNEYLRRRLEGEASRPQTKTTDEDWKRSGEIFADLADPDVMSDAWR